MHIYKAVMKNIIMHASFAVGTILKAFFPVQQMWEHIPLAILVSKIFFKSAHVISLPNFQLGGFFNLLI